MISKTGAPEIADGGTRGGGERRRASGVVVGVGGGGGAPGREGERVLLLVRTGVGGGETVVSFAKVE